MRNKLDGKMTEIELKRAMVRNFLDNLESKDNKMSESMKWTMKSLRKYILELLTQKLPISDDLLMLSIHFEMEMEGKSILETETWQTLSKVCLQVLSLPLNKAHWLWFKSYIMQSAIFYQTYKSSTKENGTSKRNDIGGGSG